MLPVKPTGVEMAGITLSRNQFRDKVRACWLGKNIGGTLGAPYETKKEVNSLEYFDPVPAEPAPNDDLDFQLAWLALMEEKNRIPLLPELADYWRTHLRAYPWNEYGFCMRNIERGLMPPVSGWFENYYVDEMGSPIRSEIWACVSPADPQRAAALAWTDSALDHAGGEGMWGEMFWAAMESAAFVLDEPLDLIRLGLSMIPPSCQIARVTREAVWCFENGRTWAQARERIVTTYGHHNPCNAVPNQGFIIIGLLYGADFGDRLCKAVNCGYDTDCTGATLGSLLGILGGTACIPEKWSGPVGERIVLHKFTRISGAPLSVGELTDRTVAMAEKLGAGRVAFGPAQVLPSEFRSALFRNEEACAAAAQDVCSSVAAAGGAEIIFHYGGEPVFHPGEGRRVRVSLRREGRPVAGAVALKVPPEWKAVKEGPESAGFEVTAGDFHESRILTVDAKIDGESHSAAFTVLAPEEAGGFPSSDNVEYCPRCQGRKGSCICGD